MFDNIFKRSWGKCQYIKKEKKNEQFWGNKSVFLYLLSEFLSFQFIGFMLGCSKLYLTIYITIYNILYNFEFKSFPITQIKVTLKKTQYFLYTNYMFTFCSCNIQLHHSTKILPTLAIDAGIEVENWTHLNKFRATVSVLNVSFDFFKVLFPQMIISCPKHRLSHKRFWSEPLFSW